MDKLEPLDIKGFKLKKTRTCFPCRALQSRAEGRKCSLGYERAAVPHFPDQYSVPAEPCPKPMTHAALHYCRENMRKGVVNQ